MPKLKTHRGAAKRVRKTATGLFKSGRAGKSHILTKKSSKRKRHLRGTAVVSEHKQETLRLLLPFA